MPKFKLAQQKPLLTIHKVTNIKSKNPWAVALGSIKSDKKAAAARENGKKGGRPVTRS